jgi:ribosomal protein L40E
MICSECGYRNDGSARLCRSCGAALEAKLCAKQLEEKLDRLSDKSDCLTPSPFDKKIKWVFFASAPVFIVLGTILLEMKIIGLFSAIFSVLAGITAGYPRFAWSLDKIRFIFITDISDLTPSNFWVRARKIGYWLIYGMAVGLFLHAL